MAAAKKLGTKIDQLKRLKDKVDEKQKELSKLKKQYEEKKDELLNTVDKESLGGAAGNLARVSIVKTVVPQVTDWDQFNKYVIRTKSLDMYQRRLSSTAFRERLEAGKKVPGVESFTKVDLRLTAVKK